MTKKAFPGEAGGLKNIRKKTFLDEKFLMLAENNESRFGVLCHKPFSDSNFPFLASCKIVSHLYLQ